MLRLAKLTFLFCFCWSISALAQTSDSTSVQVGFSGTLTQATELAREKGMNFFVVVWEDEESPAYKNLVTILSDSTVIQAFDGKVLPLVAQRTTSNGMNLEKQFGFTEFPTAMFVSLEGEELYTLEAPAKLAADQLIDLYERNARP
ncbi:MAG: hypothetical protein GC178_18335 [Flavobacteriales bacterium]|nr:hypothetical protein [Flavobacteriales bacterium]